MKKLIVRFLKWLKIVKQSKVEPEQEFVADFSKDKDLWINLKGRPKIKLRKHIREISEEITKVSNNRYSVNREIVIAYYNKYGLVGMHTKLLDEFEEFNLRNSKK